MYIPGFGFFPQSVPKTGLNLLGNLEVSIQTLHPGRLMAGTSEHGPPGRGKSSGPRPIIFRFYVNLRLMFQMMVYLHSNMVILGIYDNFQGCIHLQTSLHFWGPFRKTGFTPDLYQVFWMFLPEVTNNESKPQELGNLHP